MNYTFKIIISILFFCLIFNSGQGQITLKKTDVDYSGQLKENKVIHILSFWKNKDSIIYTSAKYSVSDFNTENQDRTLINEIPILKQLWEIAEDSIQMNLQSFNIGYPLLYTDILEKHINAFINSKEWQDHVKKNVKKLDYQIIKDVMIKYNVYEPLNDFLKSKNYEVKEIETEKHGFITKENLQKAGFSGSEIIPMPFIVWIII